jgi:Spy/CpxP family protein refolding chaperone
MKNTLGIAALFAASLAGQAPFGVLTSSTPPDPATMIASQVARLTKLLNLTTAQAAQATTIFTNAQTSVSPLQTSMNTARQALPAAVQANNAATIDQLSTTIGTLTGQITGAQNKADAAFYAILTADQKTTLGTNFPGPGFGVPGFGGPGPGGPHP